MSSRKEEKERRREERLAKERAAAAAAARKQRLSIALGALVAMALVGVAAALAAGAFTGDGESGPRQAGDAPAVELPEQVVGDVEEAAKAAKCTLRHPELEDANHEDRVFTTADYKTNPPTSGVHNPVWYEDGIYESGSAPDLGRQVHTLEHGRINVQYRPGTPSSTIAQLEALLSEQSSGYHMLLYENVTEMPFEVAATAWGHSLGCETMNDKVFDALRTFRTEYIDQGPEDVP